MQTAGQTATNYSPGKSQMEQKGSYFLQRPDVVHSTDDYDLFRFVKVNRTIDYKMVKRLAVEFKKYGQLIPIVVNERFEAVDGQHRLLACKLIGKPVRFIVQHGMNVSEIISINSVSHKWTELDYINRYAEEGNPAYVQLKEWIQQCQDFTARLAVLIAQNSLERRTIFVQENGKLHANKPNANDVYVGTHIKNGLWKGFDQIEAEQRLNKIRAVRAALPEGIWKDACGMALIQLFRIKEFNVDRLVYQLHGYGMSQVRKPVSTEDAVKVFEDVYNYKRPHTTRLSMVINPQRKAK